MDLTGLLLLLLNLSGAFCAVVQTTALNKAGAYLRHYGYLNDPTDPQELAEALRIFQRVNNLPITGELTEATLEVMRLPRCGIKENYNNLNYVTISRWSKKSLTYRIMNYTPDMNRADVRKAIHAAFRYWSDVTDLTFREIHHGRADIKLSFHSRWHSPCPDSFDGPGNTLAHALPPERGIIHFDEDEHWTEGTYSGINLRMVATHEIGHAIGLAHSEVSTAVMGAYHHGYNPDFRLHPDDIAGIRALYGTPTTSEGGYEPEVNPCSATLDAIMLGPWSYTYAFSGDYVWAISDEGPSTPVRINTLWKELPGNLDAAVYSHKSQRTYFFKGSQVWRYIGFTMEQGSPHTTMLPRNIDAALYLEDLILIKGSRYWQWDEYSQAVPYPRPLSTLFTGVPSSPDAALTWTNGRIYFFKGDNYWRVNDQLSVDWGYPMSVKRQWMNC